MIQVDGAADAVNGQVAATAAAMSFVCCCLQRVSGRRDSSVLSAARVVGLPVAHALS